MTFLFVRRLAYTYTNTLIENHPTTMTSVRSTVGVGLLTKRAKGLSKRLTENWSPKTPKVSGRSNQHGHGTSDLGALARHDCLGCHTQIRLTPSIQVLFVLSGQ